MERIRIIYIYYDVAYRDAQDINDALRAITELTSGGATILGYVYTSECHGEHNYDNLYPENELNHLADYIATYSTRTITEETLNAVEMGLTKAVILDRAYARVYPQGTLYFNVSSIKPISEMMKIPCYSKLQTW